MPAFQSVLEFIDAMIEEELVQDVIDNKEPGECVEDKHVHGSDSAEASSSESDGAAGW